MYAYVQALWKFKNVKRRMHKCKNDKVKVLNGFINVFGRNVLLMVTLTPYDCYD